MDLGEDGEVAKQVLVVDDEPKIVEVVGDYLRRAGFSVTSAADGEAAVASARARPPDLVVLDLGLPGLDGLDVARQLRRASRVPIIMLTARGDETDRVLGLELGADDYLVKPFSPRELVARVRAVLRRTEAPQTTGERFVVGNVLVDTGRREVTVADRPVELTDMVQAPQRRALPMDLGPARAADPTCGSSAASAPWVEPFTGAGTPPPPGRAGDPAEAVASREAVRQAFDTLLRLPPRQRAALVLCDVLRWPAAEVAELMDSSVASVNSALQRARSVLAGRRAAGRVGAVGAGETPDDLLARYVDAFDRCDLDSLVSLLRTTQPAAGPSSLR